MTIQEFEQMEFTVTLYKQLRGERDGLERSLKTIDEMEGRDLQIHFSGISTWFGVDREIVEEFKAGYKALARKRLSEIERTMGKLTAPKTSDLYPNQ